MQTLRRSRETRIVETEEGEYVLFKVFFEDGVPVSLGHRLGPYYHSVARLLAGEVETIRNTTVVREKDLKDRRR